MNTSPIKIDGFRAAEAWHIQLCANAKAAAGYLFPSLLRQCFAELPESAQGDFLDGVGALFVNFQVIGEPVPGHQNLSDDVMLSAMSHEEQDRWAQAQDAEGDEA